MDVDPVRWVQGAAAIVGAALLGLGLYVEAVPVMWLGGGVLVFAALCVTCYKL
jgi:uncharacterized membrane protein YqgA involved in biofilm formation